MEQISVQSSALSWDRPAGFPDGLKRKVLRSGPDGKPRAALMRLAPGFEMAGHAHDLPEQHFVIEGMYESQGHEYAAGSYRFIPAHADHGPFRSRAGAVVLVVWGS